MYSGWQRRTATSRIPLSGFHVSINQSWFLYFFLFTFLFLFCSFLLLWLMVKWGSCWEEKEKRSKGGYIECRRWLVSLDVAIVEPTSTWWRCQLVVGFRKSKHNGKRGMARFRYRYSFIHPRTRVHQQLYTDIEAQIYSISWGEEDGSSLLLTTTTRDITLDMMPPPW